MIGSAENKKSILRKRKRSDDKGASQHPFFERMDGSISAKRAKINNQSTFWDKCTHYISNKLHSFIYQNISMASILPFSAKVNLQQSSDIKNVGMTNEEQSYIPEIQCSSSLQKQIAWAHGSSSATLVGASFTDYKLYSTGQMMQLFVEKGIMPFSGTFDGGSSLAGVNQMGISGVTHHTSYKLSDAWRYAEKYDKKSVALSAESLLDNLIDTFKKIKSSDVITEEQISQYSRAMGRLKIWDKNELMKWATYSTNLKDIKKLHQAIFATVKGFQSKLDRAFSLLGDNLKLKSFMKDIETNLKDFTQKDHESLVGEHPFGFKATPQVQLIDVIYLSMRKQRLIYTPRQRAMIESITHQAGSLYSFGGWPASALANSITSVSDATFESQYIAVLTGYIVTHSKSVRKILGRENFPGNPDRYSPQTMFSELTQLQKRLDRFQMYVHASLDFSHDVVSYTQADKDLASQQLPILFCATKMHNDMRDAKHESVWESKDGIALGPQGIDVLLTDTTEHQVLIQDYLAERHLEHAVSVGVYKV